MSIHKFLQHAGYDSVSCSQRALLEAAETQDKGADDDAHLLQEKIRQGLV